MMERLSISELARKGWLYFSDGYRTKKPELGPSGFPIMRVAQVLDGYVGPASDPEYVRDEFKKKIGLKSSVNGDVILTTKGTVGRMAKITAKDVGYVYSPQVCFFRILDDSRIDKDYLFYTMAAEDFRRQMLSVSTQTDMAPYINLKDLGSIEMDLPHLSEQRSIAHVLSALDDKIELNRRMNATLEAMAQAVFKEWFVDGNAPGGAKKEWEVKTMRGACDIFDSKRVPLSNREREKRQGPYPYYGAASVMDYVDDFLFEGIHVLMGEDGSVLNTDGTPVLQYVWGKMWVNNHAHVLTGKGNISNEHLLLALKEVQLAPYVTGAVQMKLNQGNLFKIPFLIPPPEVCKAFNDIVGPLYAKLRANTDESRTLTALRDTLLPKLMRGEVRVKEKSTAPTNA